MGKTGNNIQQPMTFRKLKISEIEEAFYNPRKTMKRDSKKYANLKNSLEQFGCVEPLVVNEVNSRLISGHQRLNVLRDLGETEVDVSIVHIEDEAKEKALNISLNKVKGKWDTKKLADVLRDIDDEFNALDLGFEESDIADFLKNDEDITASIGRDKAEEMDSNSKIGTEKLASTVSIAGVRFKITADEYTKLEQDLVEKGFFSEKEISNELKRRFIADDTDGSAG